MSWFVSSATTNRSERRPRVRTVGERAYRGEREKRQLVSDVLAARARKT